MTDSIQHLFWSTRYKSKLFEILYIHRLNFLGINTPVFINLINMLFIDFKAIIIQYRIKQFILFTHIFQMHLACCLTIKYCNKNLIPFNIIGLSEFFEKIKRL